MITFSNPATLASAQRFIEPARTYPQIWRIALAISIFAVVFIIFGLLIPIITTIFMGQEEFAIFARGLVQSDTRAEVVFLLVSFIGWVLAVILAVLIMHRRGLGSILGSSGGKWLRLFVFGILAVWLYQFLSILGTNLFLESDEVLEQQHAVGDWAKWLLLLLPLLFVQVSAEELAFRGYLQQQLASISQNRLVWWILPSVLFAALHYQPSSFGSNAWIVVCVTLIIGLVAADITMRTGNLWAAIGLHFGNNLSGLALFAQKGMLSGFSLYLSPLDLSDEVAIRPVLTAQLICAVIGLVVYLVIADRMRRD